MAALPQPLGDPEPGGKLIQLPLAERSCFTCVNMREPLVAGNVTSYCTVYDEVIDSELYAAEDCFTYERCEAGSQPELVLEET